MTVKEWAQVDRYYLERGSYRVTIPQRGDLQYLAFFEKALLGGSDSKRGAQQLCKDHYERHRPIAQAVAVEHLDAARAALGHSARNHKRSSSGGRV